MKHGDAVHGGCSAGRGAVIEGVDGTRHQQAACPPAQTDARFIGRSECNDDA